MGFPSFLCHIFPVLRAFVTFLYAGPPTQIINLNITTGLDYFTCTAKARQESEPSSEKEGSRRIKSERKTFETGSWKRLLLIIQGCMLQQSHATATPCSYVKVISFQFMSLVCFFCFVGSCIFDAFAQTQAHSPTLLSNKVHDLRTPSSSCASARRVLVHGQVL